MTSLVPANIISPPSSLRQGIYRQAGQAGPVRRLFQVPSAKSPPQSVMTLTLRRFLVLVVTADTLPLAAIGAGAGPATEVWVPELDLSEGPVVAFHRVEEGLMVLLVRMAEERRPKVGCHYKIVSIARREDDKEKWSVEKVHLLKLPGVEVEGRFIGRDGRRIRFGRPVDAGNMKDLGDEAYFAVRVSRRDGGWKVEDEIFEVGCGKMQGLEGSDYDLLNVGFADDGAVAFVGHHKEKGTGSVKFEDVFVEGGDLRPKVVGDGEYWPSRFSARAGRLRSRAVAE